MKVSQNTKNIQYIRNILEESDVKKALIKCYPKSRVLVGNFGFIISPKSTKEAVKKYYTSEEYFKKEKNNYTLISSLDIQTPKILSCGKERICETDLSFIEFENIRLEHPRFQSILDIDTLQIAKILSKIHQHNFNGGKTIVHGNLHQSNFFTRRNGEIGIFDFVSMHFDDIEYDFATLYLHSDCNDDFLNLIIDEYTLKHHLSHKKIYIHTILKMRENIKGNIYIDEYETKRLKVRLLQLKYKLGNTI